MTILQWYLFTLVMGSTIFNSWINLRLAKETYRHYLEIDQINQKLKEVQFAARGFAARGFPGGSSEVDSNEIKEMERADRIEAARHDPKEH